MVAHLAEKGVKARDWWRAAAVAREWNVGERERERHGIYRGETQCHLNIL